MDFGAFIRSAFGFPRNRFDQGQTRDDFSRDDFSRDDSYDREDQSPPHDFSGGPPSSFNNDRTFFNVFTNPVDMERFFNQEMESLMKSFGFSSQPRIWELPPGEEGGSSRPEPGSRDFMLKEGSTGPGILPNKQDRSFKDEAIDGISSGDLDKLYGKTASSDWDSTEPHPGFNFGPVLPGFSFPVPFGHDNNRSIDGDDTKISSFSFGRSITSSRMVLPDGTVEERRCVRDSNGNETTTVTKIIDGKSTTTTTTTTTTSGDPNHFKMDTPSVFGDFLARKLFGDFFCRPSFEAHKDREDMLQPIPEKDTKDYKSIFNKLFGH